MQGCLASESIHRQSSQRELTSASSAEAIATAIVVMEGLQEEVITDLPFQDPEESPQKCTVFLHVMASTLRQHNRAFPYDFLPVAHPLKRSQGSGKNAFGSPLRRPSGNFFRNEHFVLLTGANEPFSLAELKTSPTASTRTSP